MNPIFSLRYLSKPDGAPVALVQSPSTIGRAEDNLVVLEPESAASRHHAELSERDGSWYLRDLGSLNGTFVNGQRIEWPRRLESGDQIKIGRDVLVFSQNPSVPESQASSPKDGSMATDSLELEAVRELGERLDAVLSEMGRVIIGQRDTLRALMLALVARGHVLMIGLPGLAKTLMIRTLAEVLDMRFRRVQFTPDLMPADITGTDVLEIDEATGKKAYRFIRGAIFTNILLADEINRTPPKTQAALLEAMQEAHVTASGETYPLPRPFFVLATQNPLEHEGTYPLPEAQLDRFMFSLKVGYPTEDEEEAIAAQTTADHAVELAKRLGAEDILRIQSFARKLPVALHVVKYATRLARATRPEDPRAPDAVRKYVHCGAGPRATQFLLLAAKASALLRGSVVVRCDDVRSAALPVLRHRLFTNFNADSDGMDADALVRAVLAHVAEPGEKDYA